MAVHQLAKDATDIYFRRATGNATAASRTGIDLGDFREKIKFFLETVT